MTEQPPGGAVAVAYVHTNEVHYSWHHSLIQLLDHDLASGQRIWSGGWVSIRCGTDGLADARNRAVRDFLADGRADWLWWIDTDMGFAPDTVDRLLEAADPAERPVMGALTFANREIDNDGMGGRRALAAPVIMHWTHDGDEAGFDTRWDYPADTVIRCDGVGAACVLIHRSVLERIAAECGPNWYTRTRNPSTGEMISEDLSFCVRAGALNIPIHVHTGVKTTHAKMFWLSETDYWRERALNAPPPKPGERTWTVPRYAIIPTHNRPEKLRGLVAALGSQCDVIVIVDNASTPAVDQADLDDAVPNEVTVEVIRDEEQPPNLAKFWNVMFERCRILACNCGNAFMVGDHVAECPRQYGYDIAVLNDDSVVPAGWYDACANGLRNNPDAVIAHTTPTSPALLTRLFNNVNNRMCPHAFVVRGLVGLRADENMRWWYQDTDLDFQARLAGGTLSVPGPRVINAHANETTVGPLAEQAEKDRAVFEAKWSR